MSLAITLLVLRIISALLLLAMVALLLVIIWQDYRSAALEVEASRRVYGYLVGLEEVDEAYVPSGDVYPLMAQTTLGRAPTNTIRIEDPFASSEHCAVVLRDGVWWLEDRDSRNGTNLNGIEVDQPLIVTDGDIINVGTVHLRIDIESTSAPIA